MWIAHLGRTVVRLAVIRPATAVVLLLLSAFLGTAAALPPGKVPGLTIPPALLHRADQIID
jgi:hypothetical protein